MAMSSTEASVEASAAVETAETAASPAEATAMIDALKRKLLGCASELQSTRDTLASTQQQLEVEKREHVLTTTKLTSLLRKRSAAPSNTPVQDNSTTDVGLLHQQIGMLQQQLRCSQEGELQLREQLASSVQQYEKLRVLTLEGLRVQRATDRASADLPTAAAHVASETGPASALPLADASVASASDTAAAASAAPAACAAPSAATTPPTNPSDGTRPPSPGPKPPPAVVEALRLAMQPATGSLGGVPMERLASVHMWSPRPADHAEPRVGMTRSRSDLSALDALHGKGPGHGKSPKRAVPLPAAPLSRSVSCISSAEIAPEIASSVGDGASNHAAILPPPSPLATAASAADRAAPFGYAQGAICVELPKRQRTVTSTLHSPRLG